MFYRYAVFPWFSFRLSSGTCCVFCISLFSSCSLALLSLLSRFSLSSLFFFSCCSPSVLSLFFRCSVAVLSILSRFPGPRKRQKRPLRASKIDRKQWQKERTTKRAPKARAGEIFDFGPPKSTEIRSKKTHHQARAEGARQRKFWISDPQTQRRQPFRGGGGGSKG